MKVYVLGHMYVQGHIIVRWGVLIFNDSFERKIA